MSTLLVLTGHNTGDWFKLDSTTLVVGREQALLAGISDPCVSRRHLEVRCNQRDGSRYAVDLGSRNGVIINGERLVNQRDLVDGDLIQIGLSLLIFTTEDFAGFADAEAFVEKATRRHQDSINDLESQTEQRRQRALEATDMSAQAVPA